MNTIADFFTVWNSFSVRFAVGQSTNLVRVAVFIGFLD